MISLRQQNISPDLEIVKQCTVTYPGRLGAPYTGLGVQILAPKKVFFNFLFEDKKFT